MADTLVCHHEGEAGEMQAMKAWLRYWGPALLMMVLIFIASGTEGSDMPKFGIWDLVFKKGGHLIGYGLLGVAYLHGLARGIFANRRALLFAILLAGLYAITDEFHQSFIPGRTPSPVDVGIDTLGASLGAALGAWLRSRPA